MCRKAIASAFAVLALAASLAAQSKPNFSGTWKLNVAKSDFGVLPPSNGRTDIIDHQDPNLKDTVSDDAAQGQQNYTLAMTTDGVSTSIITGTLSRSQRSVSTVLVSVGLSKL